MNGTSRLARIGSVLGIAAALAGGFALSRFRLGWFDDRESILATLRERLSVEDWAGAKEALRAWSPPGDSNPKRSAGARAAEACLDLMAGGFAEGPAIDPDAPGWIRGLALYRSNRFEESASILGGTVEPESRDRPEVARALAESLIALGRWEECERYLTEALSEREALSGTASLWDLLGLCRSRTGGDAEGAWARSKRLAPKRATPWLLSARRARESGEPERASIEIERATRIRPTCPAVARESAAILRASGKPGESVRAALEAARRAEEAAGTSEGGMGALDPRPERPFTALPIPEESPWFPPSGRWDSIAEALGVRDPRPDPVVKNP